MERMAAETGEQNVAIVIPVMAERLQHIIDTYQRWSVNGFEVVFVVEETQRKQLTDMLETIPKHTRSFITHVHLW